MDKGEPKADAGDYVYALTRAGISQIPFVGAPVAEILPLILAPPMEKRRSEWLKDLGEQLKLLEKQVEGFKLESLQNNETFITTAIHASQAAIRNHQQEKLDALRNAVLNSALPNTIEEDLQLIFLNFVDELSTWHLRELKFFDNPRAWGQKNNIDFGKPYTGSPSQIFEKAFSELRGRSELYNVFTKDLFSRGLMTTDSLGGMMSESGIFASRITNMGKEFLQFITSPIKEELKRKN
jgi:hypothetical protein